MYYYIVDPQKISQREFERVQNLLYSSLSEYRISGEVVRVTGLRTITQLVETAFTRGVKTLVAVGNDDTLNDLINAVKGREVLIGFIPVVESEVGNILGIRNIEQGAKTIAQRRIAQLDLGVVNQNYFVSKLNFGLSESADSGIFSYKFIQSLARLPELTIKFAADNQFRGEIKAVAGSILNARGDSEDGKRLARPTDGILDVVWLSKLSSWQALTYRKQILAGEFEQIPGSSVVHVKKFEITAPAGLALRAGERVIAKTPAMIEVVPGALKIIVGKDRKF